MTTFEEIPSEVNKSIGNLLEPEETSEKNQEEDIKIEEGTKENFVNEVNMFLNENVNDNENESGNGNESENGNESDNDNENDDCEYELSLIHISEPTRPY